MPRFTSFKTVARALAVLMRYEPGWFGLGFLVLFLVFFVVWFCWFGLFLVYLARIFSVTLFNSI